MDELDLTLKEIKEFNTKMSFRKAKGYKLRKPITGCDSLPSDRGDETTDFLT